MTITDTLGLVTVTTLNLSVGETRLLTGNYLFQSSDISRGSLVSQATAVGTYSSVSVSSNTLETTVVTGLPDLSFLNYYGSPSVPPFLIGDPITYYFTVQNTGDFPLSVTISNNLIPSIIINITLLDLGHTQTVSGIYYFQASDVLHSQINSQATAVGQYYTTDVSASRTTSITTGSPNIKVISYHGSAPAGLIVVGSPVTYQVSVTNTGQFPLMVTVSDNLGSPVVVIPDLAIGFNETVDLIYPITQNDINLGLIVSTATATGTYGSATVSSNESTSVTITQTPELTLSSYYGTIQGPLLNWELLLNIHFKSRIWVMSH